MIRLMLIPESLDMARKAVSAGVDCLFVDLERAGKFERQGAGTWISSHTVEDVSAYRDALPNVEVLVRTDPWPQLDPAIIDDVIARGADMVMLPMIEETDHLRRFVERVAGRARVVPLIETARSAEAIDTICQIDGVSEVYVGLNDLHRQLQCRFIFEPLADGLIDRLYETVHGHGLPFGFGGMAQIGHGDLPAERILGEHVRMGSSAVILSRKFKGDAGDDFDWNDHIARVRELEAGFARRSAETIEQDRQAVIDRIHAITARLNRTS